MKRFRVFVLPVVMLFCCILFVACGGSGNQNVILLSYYDSTTYQEGSDVPEFNKDLFYINDVKVTVPDPFVLTVTDKESTEYGYYYLYGTSDKNFDTWRSKDLLSWEPVNKSGLRVGILNVLDKTTDMGKAVDKDIWAPEVVYDADVDKYYLFFSATPTSPHAYHNYKSNFQMYCAVADEPYGPFNLLERENYESENFNHYFSKYLYFNMDEMIEREAALNWPQSTSGASNDNYLRMIDPHPFVDDDGTKYLFFTWNGGRTEIAAIKMKDNNWETPDSSTLTRITKNGYYTVEGDEINPSEVGSVINEGACVVKKDGKYNLTLSFHSYGNQSYSVLQAVADNPLGPYRKLTQDEGGVLLSTDGFTLDTVSGPGHHSFVTVDGQMYIVYHKHVDILKQGAYRHVAIDRVEWVKIKDKDNKDLSVMYTAATTSLQARPDFASDYKNITNDATITATKLESGSSASYLNDKLLSFYTVINKNFVDKYIHETVITDTSTITLKFNDYRDVRAIMIYNSKYMETAFKEIESIEFDYKDGDTTGIKRIENLAFDWKGNVDINDDETIRRGAAAIAEFYEMPVKEIRLTVKIPSGQTKVGLSEIVVLGK